SGTLYVWSAGTLPAGATFTFTITGSAGTVCAPTGVTNSSYVEGATVCSATQSVQTGGNFVISAPALAVNVTKILSLPSGPNTGNPVSYLLVVENTGTATITDVTVVDTLSPVFMYTGTTAPGAFGPPTTSPVATGTRFEW